MYSQNVPDSAPRSPVRVPASDRSVQGDDAQAKAVSSGMSEPRTSRMSPNVKW